MIACDAVVIGAGPAGLATALGLGRTGVDVLLVERRTGVSKLPKAMAVSARSMELLRQWGCDRPIRQRGLPPWRSESIEWRTSLVNGRHIVSLPQVGDTRDVLSSLAVSPQAWINVPQYVVENVLRDAVGRLPNVRFCEGTEATVEEQGPDGVFLRLVRATADAPTQGEQRVRAQYVVAADGSRASTRRRLGVGAHGAGPLGTALSIAFHADPAAFRDLRSAFHWVANADLVGMVTLVSQDFAVLNILDDPSLADVHQPTPRCEHLVGLVRRACGVPDLEVGIEAAERWNITQDLADTYRRERTFLVGDAAHRFPPTGGLGLNTALAEAHNLAWKLDAVLAGWAADELLDTYEHERRPYAQAASVMAVRHFRSMLAVMERIRRLPGRVESGGRQGRAFRHALAGIVARTGRNYSADAVSFGYSYQTGGDPVSDGREGRSWPSDGYVPDARPGARAPHVWLLRDGRPVSSLDLFEDGFTLLAGPEGHVWMRAARRAGVRCGVPLSAFTVGGGGPLEDPCGRWAVIYGVGPGGAVLVRPDGHVAWRATGAMGSSGEEEPARMLVAVLKEATYASGTPQRLNAADLDAPGARVA
ncbi:FAD-dependent oxidoreductase [Streptomyces griseochromogenes]|uniref:FAD-dependent oxidoreductase n=1 Tax=Streptomyces griseochromogenes TaxID=68214 RepID=UPI0037B109A9